MQKSKTDIFYRIKVLFDTGNRRGDIAMYYKILNKKTAISLNIVHNGNDFLVIAMVSLNINYIIRKI